MAIRYTTSVAPKKVAKVTDEAILSAHVKALEAYTELQAVMPVGQQIMQCMESCTMAVEAIKKYGVNKVTMGIFDKGHALTEALECTAVALEAFDAMSTASKAKLQAQYVAGLEGKIADALKAFVNWIAKLCDKLTAWVKNVIAAVGQVLTRIAPRAQKLMKEDFEIALDKKVKLAKASEMLKIVDATNANPPKKIPEAVEGTVKELGYGDVATIRRILEHVANKDVQKTMADANKEIADLRAEARTYAAKNPDGLTQEDLANYKETANEQVKQIRVLIDAGKLILRTASTLMGACKVKKAEKPAEKPAK